MRDAQLESMLTARQVADFLHVSVSTVRRWSDSGMLKFYRIGSRGDRRYSREDILPFLEQSSASPGTDAAKNGSTARTDQKMQDE
jgi:excisionase family DNA binding protein